MEDTKRTSVIAVVLMAVGVSVVAATPVARVGSRAVDERTLAGAVQRALNSGYFHRNLSKETRARLEKEQLDLLVRRELNVLGGLDRGLKPDLASAAAQRAAMEKQLGKAEYERSIVAFGWRRADHERVIAETALGEQAYRRFVAEPARVGDEDVRQAFDADPGRWVMPEAIHVQHILIAVAADADAKTVVQREADARALALRLAAGESFADLARQHSNDPYRVKGGDLGWVHRGRLAEPLEAACWRGKVGELVGPMRARDGWHLAKVLAQRASHAMTFSEVAPMLRKELEGKRLRDAEERFYAEVKSRHPVEILRSDLYGETIKP